MFYFAGRCLHIIGQSPSCVKRHSIRHDLPRINASKPTKEVIVCTSSHADTTLSMLTSFTTASHRRNACFKGYALCDFLLAHRDAVYKRYKHPDWLHEQRLKMLRCSCHWLLINVSMHHSFVLALSHR